MATTTMLNIRLDTGLKAEGESVLKRAGLTATDAIRALYRHMDRTHEVPDCCLESEDVLTSVQKRQAMRNLVGIAPLEGGQDARTIREERLSRHSFGGPS